MSSANSNQPIFPEAEKFDGTNFGTFKTKTIVSGSLRITLTFRHAVHTPDLIVNLISISKLLGTLQWRRGHLLQHSQRSEKDANDWER